MEDLFIPSVFFTLFFVVDPLGQIPLFLVYLAGFDEKKKRKTIIKAIAVSIAVSIFFVFFGSLVLHFLGITPGAFLIAGGILLFLISMDMLFGRPPRTKTSGDTPVAIEERGDVSIFPLAIPFLSGPGNIAALLMFSSQVKADIVALTVIIGMSILVFLLTMLVMFLSAKLERVLGDTGISFIQRLMGLILSALAIQFIANGLRYMGII